MWIKRCYLSLLLINFANIVIAQTDSVEYIDIDTFFIYKAPVVIHKKITPTEETWTGPFALEVFASPLYYGSYYDVCKTCPEQTCRILQSSSPSLSFSLGSNLVYMRKKLYATFGVGYTSIRENFDYTSSTQEIHTTNKFSYYDISATAGYVIRKNNISVALFAGGGISRLASSKGFTFSKSDGSLKDLRNENHFMKTTQQIITGINFMYKVSDNFNISLAPTYLVNTGSIIKKEYLFVQQRNILGLKTGLLFFL